MDSYNILKCILEVLKLWLPVILESVMRWPLLLLSTTQLTTQNSRCLSREHVEALVEEISHIRSHEN